MREISELLSGAAIIWFIYHMISIGGIY